MVWDYLTFILVNFTEKGMLILSKILIQKLYQPTTFAFLKYFNILVKKNIFPS